MNLKLPILAVLAGLGISFSSSAAAQQAGSDTCENEQPRPNLHIAEAAKVSGTVSGASGAFFSNIVLQIQNPHNTWVLKSAAVNDKGEFDFGRIPPGEFRLVPVKLLNGKAIRITGFDPPRDLTCFDDRPCELRITLPTRPTEQPFENCPPK